MSFRDRFSCRVYKYFEVIIFVFRGVKVSFLVIVVVTGVLRRFRGIF